MDDIQAALVALRPRLPQNIGQGLAWARRSSAQLLSPELAGILPRIADCVLHSHKRTSISSEKACLSATMARQSLGQTLLQHRVLGSLHREQPSPGEERCALWMQ